jgi:hypothetical protein
MDVHYFFRSRIAFIRQLYENACNPFTERKRKIEAGEAPFEPPYSEDGEPPFVAEWIEAEDSLHMIGYACISMLAAALHLYFSTTWETKTNVKTPKRFNDGWFAGYRAYYKKHFNVDFADGPCDLKVLEEVVLARNRAQHPDNLVMTLPTYTDSDMKKLPSAMFVDTCSEIYQDLDGNEREWLMPPTLHVSQEKLCKVIKDVERFVEWLDPQIEIAVYRR